MNIFVLDADPTVAATMLCDQHVGKMLLEACQLLCNCHDSAPYKRTHFNHPCSVWVRASSANYFWLASHALALAAEYEYRFGRRHGSSDVAAWCAAQASQAASPMSLPFAQVVPEQYRGDDAVQAYRRYYAAEKRVLRGRNVTWTRRPTPAWFMT